jgi:hypothetical protein
MPSISGTIFFIVGRACAGGRKTLCADLHPALLMGYFLSPTTVSEFAASMERLCIPKQIIAPFLVMFRFLSTIGKSGVY